MNKCDLKLNAKMKEYLNTAQYGHRQVLEKKDGFSQLPLRLGSLFLLLTLIFF